MTETPPELHLPRPDEPTPADETTMLRNWLQYHRDSAIWKIEGLDHSQLRWAPAATANSLGAIVVHLGLAERFWVRVIFADEPMDLSFRAAMFDLPDSWSVDDVVAFYRAESALADAVLDTAESLDLPSRASMRPTTLRWVLVHLVEETARHVGHMDITRELLDGSVGR
jgi:hypothetical protein